MHLPSWSLCCFDTIDHNILITRLSVSMALFWAGSSLTYYFAPSVLNVKTASRPSILPLMVFSKALFSALYIILFIMYTTPVSTLISSLSLDHHLYADDTQLFFSFYPLNYDSSISHIQNAFQHFSPWMTANLITLNCSKTEFLLMKLKNKLANYHSSLTYPTLFIFNEHLTFSDQITSLSKACYYHIRQLRCIWLYLGSSTACTIATSIVHSKLDYCNSIYYKLPKFKLFRLQQIQNSYCR